MANFSPVNYHLTSPLCVWYFFCYFGAFWWIFLFGYVAKGMLNELKTIANFRLQICVSILLNPG